MKTGMNTIQLATEIERRAAAKRDLLAPSQKLLMGDDSQLAVGSETFPINALAHAQLADYVGIPKQYYDRMLAQEPQLLARNVNRWIASEPYKKDRRMVRTLADVEDYDTATEMERLGGNIIDMHKNAWRELMAA